MKTKAFSLLTKIAVELAAPERDHPRIAVLRDDLIDTCGSVLEVDHFISYQQATIQIASRINRLAEEGGAA